MHILLIKMTSMGDLIHALPAITDAQRVYPDIRFDWVADKSFVDVASWHPAVQRIIPSAHRYWRKNLKQAWQQHQIQDFWEQLRQENYDVIIDAQSNIKSAVVTRLARGAARHGMDKASVREKPAHWAYSHTHAIPKQQHAITRIRQLFAAALNYPVPDTAADFGLDSNKFRKPSITLPESYLFFVTNATWDTKLWPETYWQELITLARQANKTILLPSGNQEELERAQRLAGNDPHVIALPRLPLSEIAYIIQHATAAVAVDTGLSHLAAALIPTVSLYGATDPRLIGTVGPCQKQLSATLACAPCTSKQCTYPGAATAKIQPPCFASITPEYVWQQLQDVLV